MSCPTLRDECLLVAANCFENREHYGVLSTIIINDKASHNSLDDRAGNRNACDRNGKQAGSGAVDSQHPVPSHGPGPGLPRLWKVGASLS